MKQARFDEAETELRRALDAKRALGGGETATESKTLQSLAELAARRL